MIDSLSQTTQSHPTLGGRDLWKERVRRAKKLQPPPGVSVWPVPTPLPSRGLAKPADLPSHLQPHLEQVGDDLTWSSVEFLVLSDVTLCSHLRSPSGLALLKVVHLEFDIGIDSVATACVFLAQPMSWVLSCVYTCSIPFHPHAILKIRVSSQ